MGKEDVFFQSDAQKPRKRPRAKVCIANRFYCDNDLISSLMDLMVQLPINSASQWIVAEI